MPTLHFVGFVNPTYLTSNNAGKNCEERHCAALRSNPLNIRQSYELLRGAQDDKKLKLRDSSG